MRFRASVGKESELEPPLEIGRSQATRWVCAALALQLATLIVATYCGAALTWDGAGLLFAFLDVQDLSLPHERSSVALFQLPVLMASKLTVRVRALELLYEIAYTAVPFVAAYSSWRIVRRAQPQLFLWPFLWMTVGALPGQLFFVTESLMALHVAWPLMLMIATGLSWWRAAFGAAIVAFLFTLHPVAAPVLLFCALFAAGCSIPQRARRRELAVSAALLGAVGVVRLVLISHNPYEMSQPFAAAPFLGGAAVFAIMGAYRKSKADAARWLDCFGRRSHLRSSHRSSECRVVPAPRVARIGSAPGDALHSAALATVCAEQRAQMVVYALLRDTGSGQAAAAARSQWQRLREARLR